MWGKVFVEPKRRGPNNRIGGGWTVDALPVYPISEDEESNLSDQYSVTQKTASKDYRSYIIDKIRFRANKNQQEPGIKSKNKTSAKTEEHANSISFLLPFTRKRSSDRRQNAHKD